MKDVCSAAVNHPDSLESETWFTVVVHEQGLIYRQSEDFPLFLIRLCSSFSAVTLLVGSFDL